MNRPKIENYLIRNQHPIFNIYHYKQDLEKYCDELESKINHQKDFLTVNVKVTEIDEVMEEVKKCQKALEKACKLIDDIYIYCPHDVYNFCLHKGECDDSYAKCWKEYFSKDE